MRSRQVPDLERDKEHSLEEALLKQMEMQKKLHEQLEVRVHALSLPIPPLCCPRQGRMPSLGTPSACPGAWQAQQAPE